MLISVFFVGSIAAPADSIVSALLLAGVVLLGIGMTFVVSRVLSATILKGVPSSFTLELPPYRSPQVVQVLIRSLLDRTLFVLGRAAMVAAPAGLVIWLFANISIGDTTLLTHCSEFLDPFARLLGLDGVILFAFILGLPANEIVLPIILMTYLSQGSLTEMSDLGALRDLLIENGWTWVTAVCTMLFSLMHWPCSTSILTIHKETHSLKWTAAAIVIPTVTGLIVCFAFAQIAGLFV